MTDTELRGMTDRQLEAIIEDAKDEMDRRRFQFSVVMPQLQLQSDTITVVYVPGWMDSDEP